MRITKWTAKVVAAIAAERGSTKALKRLMAGAVAGGCLTLGAAAADAQTINHAIQDASFDDTDLFASGIPFGTGHYAYVRDLPDYPWVSVAPWVGNNNNSWLYNNNLAAGSAEQPTPRSLENATHLADGNIFQILSDAFVPGREYTLSTWVHYDVDAYVGDDFGLRLFDGTSGMWDGAEIFAAEDYFFGVDYFDDDNWHEVTLSFTAGANTNGKPIGIYLGPEAQVNRLSVDDVSLTSVPTTLPGDYNNDNLVDAADYVVWRKTDANNPDGYDEWAENFGNTPAGSGAAAGQSLSAGPVPEPSTCLLVCAAAAGFLVLGRRASDSGTTG